MTTTPRRAPAQADDSRLADAFRDLHGTRLHGFTLLVALGEAQAAERAAGEALATGRLQAPALRHPERAAAWLRARALRALHQGISRGAGVPEASRRAALAPLGVDEVVYGGLAMLSVEGRAALVASSIERFEPIDIETILGASPAAARRVIAQARTRYLEAVRDQQDGTPESASAEPDGELAGRIRDVAARAMNNDWKSR